MHLDCSLHKPVYHTGIYLFLRRMRLLSCSQNSVEDIHHFLSAVYYYGWCMRVGKSNHQRIHLKKEN